MMKKSSEQIVGNIRVGKADVDPEAPSHVRGVFQGNHPHKLERHKGIDNESESRAEGSARRSTGIRAKHHDVIDPRMPKLSPA
jgi:hypothetical protein